MSAIKIHFRSLTPLWTGDVDRDSSVPSESGIVGSLRFWFEGILRAKQIRACGETRCEGSDLCLACGLFGATGRARAFRLDMDGLHSTPVFFRASKDVATSTGNWLWNIFGGEETGGTRTKGAGGGTSYQFGVNALWSKDPFRITLRKRMGVDAEFPVLPLVALTISEAVAKGGIGAKTQYGFGQVKLVNPEEIAALAEEGSKWLGERPRNGHPNGFFTLHPDRFFRLHYSFSSSPLGETVNIGTPPTDYDQNYIPCSYDIRYKYKLRNPLSGTGMDKGMRPAVKDALGSRIAALLFGSVAPGQEPRASRIHVSHLYREGAGKPYQLKIWGDVDPAEAGVDKKEVVEVLRSHLYERFKKDPDEQV